MNIVQLARQKKLDEKALADASEAARLGHMVAPIDALSQEVVGRFRVFLIEHCLSRIPLYDKQWSISLSRYYEQTPFIAYAIRAGADASIFHSHTLDNCVITLRMYRLIDRALTAAPLPACLGIRLDQGTQFLCCEER